MTNQAYLSYRNEILFLNGRLTFTNGMSIYQQSLAYIQQMSEVKIDFTELEVSNSVGLALMIEWIKLAKKLNKVIHFFNLPTKLMAIAKAASLDHLIC